MAERGFDLEGKAIVITGASSGIGRAAAVVMGGLGARLLLAARDVPALDAVVDTIKAAGGSAERMRADMAIPAHIDALIARAHELHGRVDGLFANAGIGGPVAAFGDYPDEGFAEVLQVNLVSVFRAMKLVLPGMVERRSGAIVVTGSLASERGMPMTAGYNASKHAVLGLARSAAAEVARHNVRVNCVIPGLIETRMLETIADDMWDGDTARAMAAMGAMAPAGRVGQAEEVGRVAAFLLSDAAQYVTGQAWSVDGGILGTLTPGG